MHKILCVILHLVILFPGVLRGDVFFLDGSILETNVQANIIETVKLDQVEGNVRLITHRFRSYTSGINKQIISDYTPKISPRPDHIKTYKDKLGNEVLDIFFERILSESIKIESKFLLDNEVNIYPPSNFYEHPLSKSMIRSVKGYIIQTPATQIGKSWKAQARRLLSRKDNQFQMLMKVLTWVKSNISLDIMADENKAKKVLLRRRGNIKGILNVSLGMLRELGIPCRFVHGISTHKSFEITRRNNVLEAESFDKKQILYAPSSYDKNLRISYPESIYNWIEVYFPNLGWVPFDLYGTYFFVPPNILKRNVSLDSELGHTKAYVEDIDEDIEEAGIVTGGAYKELKDIRIKSFISGKKERNKLKITSYTKTKDFLLLPNLRIKELEYVNNLVPTFKSKRLKVTQKPFNGKILLAFNPYPLEFNEKRKQMEVRLSGNSIHKQEILIPKKLEVEKVLLPLFRFNNHPLGRVWVEIRSKRKGVEIRSKALKVQDMDNSGRYSFIEFIFSKGQILDKGEYILSLNLSTKEMMLWRGIYGNGYNHREDTYYTQAGQKMYLYLDLCFKLLGVRPKSKKEKKVRKKKRSFR